MSPTHRKIAMIPAYNEPCDIYEKLLREARRTWLAKDHIDVSDHLFNFCVTCVSLRDWTIRHLNLTASRKDDYLKSWRKTGCFGVCADIANSLKHFGIEAGRTCSITNVVQYTEKLVALGPGAIVIPGMEIEKPFFKISIDDGREIDLLIFLYQACKDWESQLNSIHLSDKNMSSLASVFIERH